MDMLFSILVMKAWENHWWTCPENFGLLLANVVSIVGLVSCPYNGPWQADFICVRQKKKNTSVYGYATYPTFTSLPYNFFPILKKKTTIKMSDRPSKTKIWNGLITHFCRFWLNQNQYCKTKSRMGYKSSVQLIWYITSRDRRIV